MSASGVDPDISFTDLGFSEADVQNQMHRAARRTVVYANSNKFDYTSLVKICPIKEVDCIITDRCISNEQKDAFLNRNTNIVIV